MCLWKFWMTLKISHTLESQAGKLEFLRTWFGCCCYCCLRWCWVFVAKHHTKVITLMIVKSSRKSEKWRYLRSKLFYLQWIITMLIIIWIIFVCVETRSKNLREIAFFYFETFFYENGCEENASLSFYFVVLFL